MQRISDGLAVPKLQLDMFTGKKTGFGAQAGIIECDLTYVPKDADHIIVPPLRTTAGYMVIANIESIAGKVVTFLIEAYKYYRTTSVDHAVGACDGSGATPSHGGHTVNNTLFDCLSGSISNVDLETVRVNYTVA